MTPRYKISKSRRQVLIESRETSRSSERLYFHCVPVKIMRRELFYFSGLAYLTRSGNQDHRGLFQIPVQEANAIDQISVNSIHRMREDYHPVNCGSTRSLRLVGQTPMHSWVIFSETSHNFLAVNGSSASGLGAITLQ